MDEVGLTELGREAYKKGDFDLAATYYRKALELQPYDYEIVNKLGSVFFLQSDFLAATKVYSDAIGKLKGQEGEVLGNMHISLAEAYLNLHRLEEAEAQVEIAGQVGANPAMLCEARGRGYNARGEYDKALAAYEEYNRLVPEENYGYLGMAKAYEGLNQCDLAAQSLNAAKALTPDDYWVEIALGNLAMTLENYNTALNHYQTARELDSRKPAVIFSMAQAYLMLEDYDNAKQMFSYALERHPNDADSLYGLAQTELSAKNEQQAIVLLKSAILIDPSNHSYYTLLVQAQAGSGKLLDAFLTALKARKLLKRQK